MAMGTNDQWEAATMGYNNIGPNYWKGEEGRLALIAGDQKLTDEAWVAPYEQLAKWGAYLGDGYRGADLSRQPEPLHAGPRRDLSRGQLGDHRLQRAGRFRNGRLQAASQNAGDTCYISDHTDIAMG